MPEIMNSVAVRGLIATSVAKGRFRDSICKPHPISAAVEIIMTRYVSTKDSLYNLSCNFWWFSMSWQISIVTKLGLIKQEAFTPAK